MKKFRIIPVLDILNSQAVHAVKGLRESYKPLISSLFHSSDPYEIAKSIRYDYGINELYIADLDSIIYGSPNFNFLFKVSKLPDLKVIIDPGIISIEDIRKISNYGFKKLILGLETIKSLSLISDCIKMIGTQKIIVSIDMYQKKIMSKIKQLKTMSIIEIVHKIEQLGVKEIILLDLYRVGQKQGGIPPLYLDIRNSYKYNILVGGGIKDFEDIIKYADLNFNGVLLGTAFYDGTIKVDDIKKFLNL